MIKPVIIIFARAPVMGLTKTRLARRIGATEATRIYRASLAAAIRATRGAGMRVVLSAVDIRASGFCAWPNGIARERQVIGDIGARMAAALNAHAPAPALLIGSDIPDIRTSHLIDAAHALRTCDVVFGPATDGGFWLIGLNGPTYRRRALLARAFAGVRWSSEFALHDVADRIAGSRVAHAKTLADAD